MASNTEPDLTQAERRLRESLLATGQIARDITNTAFKQLIASVTEYSDRIDEINEELEEQLDRYSEIKNQVKGLGEALKAHARTLGAGNESLQGSMSLYRSLTKLTDKLAYNQEDLAKGQLSSNDVAKDLSKIIGISLGLELRQKDIQVEVDQLLKDQIEAQRQGNAEEAQSLANKISALGDINNQLEAQKTTLTDITSELTEQAKQAKAIEQKVGMGGKLLDGFKKIPLLGKLIDVDGAKAAMQAAAANGASGFQVMGTGIKAMGPALKAALGPLALISMAIEGIKALVDMMFAADKQVTQIARNLSLSKDEAAKTKDYYASIKGDLETQYKLTASILEAENQLSKLTSLSAISSRAIIDNQIMMTKELGLSEDEATKLNGVFATNTEEGEKSLDIVYDQIAGYANQTKVLFNGRKILKEMDQVSGQLLSTFKGSTAALTNAVLRTERLGINLQKARDMSESMLDFESSIQSQMEAQLLTGKTLNLDRARALALQGDYAGASEEIMKNVGNYTEFSKMNVIQQKAIAKAVGMTSDDLADSLRKQQLITGQAKNQIALLREAGNTERADALEKGILAGKQLKEAESSLDAQEKFNIALDEAKEIFTDLISGGTLDKLVNMLKDLVESLSKNGIFGTLFGGGMEEAANARIATQGQAKAKGMAPAEQAEYNKAIEEHVTSPFQILGQQLMNEIFSPIQTMSNSTMENMQRVQNQLAAEAITDWEESHPGQGAPPKLATGGIVQQTGLAMVDRGEVYLGANSITVLKDMLTALTAIAAKDSNTTIKVDGQVLANTVAINTPTSYGNLLNPSTRTVG
jgi:hypothetical protein